MEAMTLAGNLPALPAISSDRHGLTTAVEPQAKGDAMVCCVLRCDCAVLCAAACCSPAHCADDGGVDIRPRVHIWVVCEGYRGRERDDDNPAERPHRPLDRRQVIVKHRVEPNPYQHHCHIKRRAMHGARGVHHRVCGPPAAWQHRPGLIAPSCVVTTADVRLGRCLGRLLLP